MLYCYRTVVDTATSYGLDGPGYESRQGQDAFPSLEMSTPAMGPTQYHIECRRSLPAVKLPGREVDNSPLCSVEDRSEWSCTSTPLYAFHCV